MSRRMLTALIVMAPAALHAQTTTVTPNKTYDAVVAGMSCRQRPTGQMDCEYSVGKSVRFVIGGVGQPDVIVTFTKVDEDGEFVAALAPLHGCVVVKPAQARGDTLSAFAFVSPVDGKVHRTWNACLRQPAKKDAAPLRPANY